MAEQSKARLFVLFLDTYHVDVGASHAIRKPLIDALDRADRPGRPRRRDDAGDVRRRHRLRAQDDDNRRVSVAVLALGRTRPGPARDPQDQTYADCYPNVNERARSQVRGPERYRRGVDRSPPREAGARRAAGSRPLPAHRARGAQGDPGDHQRLAAVPPGRASGATAHLPRRAHRAAGDRSAHGTADHAGADACAAGHCDADRIRLAQIDNDQQFRDILDEANRANASFYPIDPRGLAVFDTPIVRHDVPGPAPPMVPPTVDAAMLPGGSTPCERWRRRPMAWRSSTRTISPAACGASSTI